MNLDDNNYLPEEEKENKCSYCDTPCDNEYCGMECYINSIEE